jgi:HTH-type transcriptional regulator/antitoxin HigA
MIRLKVKMMNIRPLKTREDYEAALALIERLFDVEPNTPEGDQLDVLTTLVSAYEDEHFPIPEPDPIEAIKYFMESRGLTQQDLVPYFGDRQRTTDVLKRNRRLSISMIRRLNKGLGISADILIQPYKLKSETHARSSRFA